MKTWMMTTITTLVALMMLGCDEDGTPMSSYSSSELNTMCMDLLAEMDILAEDVTHEQGCSFQAAVETHYNSGDASDCEAAFQKCLGEEPDVRDDEDVCNTTYNRAAFYDCDATVDVFESCLFDNASDLLHAIKRITCETLKQDNVESALTGWLLPQDSCIDFAMQCPNFEIN